MHYICRKKGEDTKTVNMKENSDLQLSIIIPVYQVEKYVRPCLESVYKQGLDDEVFEVIIVNDGTKDRSMEVIQDIIDKHKNITVINQENQGLSMARNNGMAIARGEYLLMPDSDDLLVENSVKPLLEKALETKADMVVAEFVEKSDEEIKCDSIPQRNYQQIESTGKELYLNESLLNHVNIWRTLYRRLFLQENIITFIGGIYFEDIPFTHQCYLKAKKCIYSNTLLYIYRTGHQTISAASSFTMRHAHDLCIAIAKTWELRNMEGLSNVIKKKHTDHIYDRYKYLLYRILYCIPEKKHKIEAIKVLKKYAPDIKFTNNTKQILTSLLFRNVPAFYISLYLFRKKYLASYPNKSV